jgi:hypothetical protein
MSTHGKFFGLKMAAAATALTMAGIAFTPSVRAADGIVPPSNPPSNLPGNESIPGCQASPVSSYPTTPITSTACTAAALARLRIDRAAEGLGPVVLPSNWGSLSTPEQMFVMTNLERTARGLAPIAGLTAPLDTAAALGAAHGMDPLPCTSLARTSATTFTCTPGTELPFINTWRTIWAGEQPSPITADMMWVYDDGWGGSPSSTSNYDCTGPTATGCWGHRDAILGSYRCPYCYAGAALDPTGWPLTTGGGAASYAELFASYTTPQPTVFSWASELPYLGVPTSPRELPATGIIGMASSATSGGYWLASAHGAVFSQGKAQFHGSVTGLPVAEQPTAPVVGIVANPGGGGYWLVTSAGDVYSFGKSAFHGSTGAIVLHKPIVGMATTPHGNGYWLVAADGGVFAFGSAKFYGSMGATPLNKPIVGMASTPNGQGYWLVAADGGIFSFGDAAFHGSTGAITLAKPIVGMASTPHGNGYWLAASDGGVFAFGTAKFYGSGPDIPTTGPTSGIAATRSGYELIQADGNIHVFSPGTTTTTKQPPSHTGTSGSGTSGSGTSGSGTSGSAHYGDGILPPANPPANIAAKPNFLDASCIGTGGGAYTCNNPCYAANTSGSIVSVHDSACTAYELEAINNARAQENVAPMVLPSNWQSLTTEQRLFVVADLERVGRGLPPYLGLVPALNADAQSAAAASTDPSLPSTLAVAAGAGGFPMFGAAWAGGMAMSALQPDYLWMYEDGWGGSKSNTDNVACTSPTATGCWAHRDELLGSTDYGSGGAWWGVGLHCTTCVMGTGAARVANGSYSYPSVTDLVVKPAGVVPAMSFTWAQEASFFPGQQSPNITSLQQAGNVASGRNPR